MGKKNESTYDMLKSGEMHKRVKTLEGIVSKMSEEEFNKFVKTKELPAIKLSKNEMDALSGGWFWHVLFEVLKPAKMGGESSVQFDECGRSYFP